MSSSVDNLSESNQLLSSKNIISVSIIWSVLSLFSFVLFSLIPEDDTPLAYLLDTYILECLPFLGAAFLCFRNANSPKIASGRNVWLGIGLGALSYFTANLIFGWWELYWDLDPDISPADLFYVAFYLFLGWGMVLALLPRRLNLEKWQWITLSIIAVVGIIFALLVAFATPAESAEFEEVATPVAEETTSAPDQAEVTVPEELSSPVSEETTPPVLVEEKPVIEEPAIEEEPAVEEESGREIPHWVTSLEDTLSPLAKPVNSFYIIGDVALVIIAATLMLAYWGGTYSWSWRTIALATFALYIADMYFKYEATLPEEYQSGSLLEVFFVFSGILFGIGAMLEYNISNRPRRSRRKRPAEE